MRKTLGLSVLAIVLALTLTVGAQHSAGPSPGRIQTPSRTPSRVDGVRVERSTNASDESEGNVYTDDDVIDHGPRDKRLSEVESLEMQCFNEVNRLRVSRGLSPLAFSEDLLRVARDYSRRMAEEKFFSHDDPQGNTVKERVTDANIRWRVLGENLALSNGYINPVAVSLSGWMDSPGHRRNLLDRGWRQTAIGAWINADGTVYFTEIFLTQ
jgi:uncharacterized protein YkwD